MVGVSRDRSAARLDEFFSPAMAAAAAGLALALLVVLFRPVVRHRRRTPGGPSRGDRRRGCAGAGGHVVPLAVESRFRPAGPGPSWSPATARAPSTTSPCAPTSSSSSGATRSSPTPSTAASAWCRPIRSGRWPSGRRRGGPSAATSTSTGGRSAGSGVGEEWLPIYRATGMHDLYVGDEGVVRVGRFTLEGGRFKGLRQAVNRVAKYGYRISFHDPSQLDPALRRRSRR